MNQGKRQPKLKKLVLRLPVEDVEFLTRGRCPADIVISRMCEIARQAEMKALLAGEDPLEGKRTPSLIEGD